LTLSLSVELPVSRPPGWARFAHASHCPKPIIFHLHRATCSRPIAQSPPVPGCDAERRQFFEDAVEAIIQRSCSLTGRAVSAPDNGNAVGLIEFVHNRALRGWRVAQSLDELVV
jgi:hypothetical protein